MVALQSTYNPQSGGRGIPLQGSSPSLQPTLTVGQLQPARLVTSVQPAGGGVAVRATSPAPAAPTYVSSGTSSARVGTSRVASGGGGGGVAAPAVDPAVLAYYDDQAAKANAALGRIGNQRNIGIANIDSQYNSAFNRLSGSNAAAERDFGLKKQQTIDDNVTARADVDATVARKSQGLRRLLGNSSSAALFAAPLAVANQGNKQQGAIQKSYGRNLQNLDIADEDRKRQFNDNLSEINSQRTVSKNSLEAKLKESEASILEQLSGIALQKAQAKGQNYSQARGATQGYTSRVQSLLAEIDNLGRNPSITTKDVLFKAPELAKYETADIGVEQNQTPAGTQGGMYQYLIGDERRKLLGL